MSNLNEWFEFNIKNGEKTFVNRIQAIIIEEIMKNQIQCTNKMSLYYNDTHQPCWNRHQFFLGEYKPDEEEALEITETIE